MRDRDPDCLHCRLTELVLEHVRTRPVPPDVGELVGALVQIAGDMLTLAERADRLEMFRAAVEMMADRCHVVVNKRPREHAPARTLN
ncbi:hypothetical protein [Reyranella sp.]|uniref:hypothetical protein n=1 Tax=Reyranella sp. TaxID=1929291 RepID=UPI003D0FA761